MADDVPEGASGRPGGHENAARGSGDGAGRGKNRSERPGESPDRPPAPEFPASLREPLDRQSPERLETVVSYAKALAEWKRERREREAERRRAEEQAEDEELAALEQRDVSTDPADYEGVPDSGAYVTIKEPKPGYRYFYFQWREGDTWKNEYIAPVNPKEE